MKNKKPMLLFLLPFAGLCLHIGIHVKESTHLISFFFLAAMYLAVHFLGSKWSHSKFLLMSALASLFLVIKMNVWLTVPIRFEWLLPLLVVFYGWLLKKTI